jgi:hypothetical protein
VGVAALCREDADERRDDRRVVSLSGGALLANVVSVILLLGETLRQGARRSGRSPIRIRSTARIDFDERRPALHGAAAAARAAHHADRRLRDLGRAASRSCPGWAPTGIRNA